MMQDKNNDWSEDLEDLKAVCPEFFEKTSFTKQTSGRLGKLKTPASGRSNS